MIAVSKETIRKMWVQVDIWANELGKPKAKQHEDIVYLAGRLEKAAGALLEVINEWPDECGQVVSVDSKPLRK